MTQKTTVIETIIGLYQALETRERCKICRGTGVIFYDHQGEAEPEPCDCSEAAHEALLRYKARYESMVNIESCLTPK